MKSIHLISFLAVCVLLTGGCARNTIENRIKERRGAYASFTPEIKSMVDQGQIKVGMPMDAVYIAWGKPSQQFTQETATGQTTTWIYHDTHLEPYHYWTQRGYYHGNRYHSEPYLANDYYVQSYVSAEVVFEQGVVKEWRTLPYPVGY